MLTKTDLRKTYLQKRQALEKSLYQLDCLNICRIFFENVDVQALHVVHSFLPIENKNEPDTRLILQQLKKNYPLVKIALPRVMHNDIISYFWEDTVSYSNHNKWGIMEPDSGTIADEKQFDLVIVPLVICDYKGNRVGYGKGFYDRFLKRCRKDCLKVGLSFFEPLKDMIESEPHDIRLNACVTPASYTLF